jgi:tetratricopeptide (TPR) repeat protein
VKAALCSLILAASLAAAAFADDGKKPAVPLFDGLGDHSRKVATKIAAAQRYFDQGLMFLFAYNHDEAVRAFRHAAELDPGCAMAYWGIALGSGMNYNDPRFTPEKAKVAADALAKARAKAAAETDANRALIDALALRYPDPEPRERADAEKAYSAAMKSAWVKFAKDADLGALYAESIMNLRPWDLWMRDGKPQPGTPEILRTLDAVLRLDPAHPLANHLYIHATEASPEPGKADAAADALRGRHPGLGHLLHMPSHIDIRRGRWQEAVQANQLAIRADADYLKAAPEQGVYRMYMSHNYHMLTFAAMMQGESGRALKTIRAMTGAVPKEWAAVKANAAIVDGFMAMPLEVLKRFGRWDDVLQEPQPAEVFPIARALWQYNRGVALGAKGKIAEAREAQARFREAVALVPADATFGNNKAVDLLAIAEQVLDGELRWRDRDVKGAIAALEKAVNREDQLRYSEPPDWFVPARHALGAILLRDRQAAQAELVYREDLRRWPDNGWSLHGLAATLEALGRKAEAATVNDRFRKIWERADVQIQSSCFCVEG